MILKLKINLSKVDDSRLFTGKSGTYLDATVFVNDQVDQYGNNGMIVQDVSKEEREKGVKGAILGNCKTLQKSETNVSKFVPINEENPDGLPF